MYWHEMSLGEQEKFIEDNPFMTGEEFLAVMKQPEWCNYPKALEGLAGCWSLFNRTQKMIGKREDCRSCDMSDYFTQED